MNKGSICAACHQKNLRPRAADGMGHRKGIGGDYSMAELELDEQSTQRVAAERGQPCSVNHRCPPTTGEERKLVRRVTGVDAAMFCGVAKR